MKLLLSTAILGILCAGLFLIPLSGQTLWQRAEARGLPERTARAISRGARAAARWVEEQRTESSPPDGMPGHKPPRHEVARSAPGPRTAPAQVREKSVPTAPSAAAAHDRIVAAPPEEALSAGDRRGLDELIAGAR